MTYSLPTKQELYEFLISRDPEETFEPDSQDNCILAQYLKQKYGSIYIHTRIGKTDIGDLTLSHGEHSYLDSFVNSLLGIIRDRNSNIIWARIVDKTTTIQQARDILAGLPNPVRVPTKAWLVLAFPLLFDYETFRNQSGW